MILPNFEIVTRKRKEKEQKYGKYGKIWENHIIEHPRRMIEIFNVLFL